MMRCGAWTGAGSMLNKLIFSAISRCCNLHLYLQLINLIQNSQFRSKFTYVVSAGGRVASLPKIDVFSYQLKTSVQEYRNLCDKFQC